MAPEVEKRIQFEIAAGTLTLVAAKIVSVESDQRGALVRYRRRGESAVKAMHVAKIIECTGLTKDLSQSTNPALRSLFEQGLARADELRIGLDVTTECAIVHRSGKPSERLFAVGPLSRAAFWEVVAIPDIRNQCAELAAHLTARAGLRC